MSQLYIWALIAINLTLALGANALSTHWAATGMKVSLQLAALITISPAVFITFGMVASRTGLAVGSAIIDSLLTAGSVLIGLFLWDEWHDLSALKSLGLVLAVSGIAILNMAK